MAMETTTNPEGTMIATDPNTRAGRMMAAGRITVTFTSAATGQHITLTAKARKPGEDGKWGASDLATARVIFIEVPNADGGWNDKVGKITRARGFQPDANTDEARAYCARQLIKFVAGQPLPAGLEAREESRCGKCGRQLTDPVSIDRGIGPECYGAATGSQHQKKTRPASPEAAPTTGLRDFTGAEGQAELRRRNEARRAAATERRFNDASDERDQLEIERHEAEQAHMASATDKQGVPLAVGDWRARKDYAKTIREADGETSSPRLAELRANSSQNRDKPGCDIFGAPLN